MTNIIDYIANNNNNNKNNIEQLIDYIAYERNYYLLLHHNTNRDFGLYIHYNSISKKDQETQYRDMINRYFKEHQISAIQIDKTKLKISFIYINNLNYTILI